MLRLPIRIEAQLTDTAGRELREPAVLIGINILSNGQYYFGNLIGLTNNAGVAGIEGVELELRFLDDRSRYPMDYKIDLPDCDELIELMVLEAGDIRRASEAMEEGEVLAPIVRSQYAAARNSNFVPSLIRVIGDSQHGTPLKVYLTTRPR